MKEIDVEMNWVVALDLKCFLRGRFTSVNLVGSPGPDGRVGAVTIVPLSEEAKLSSEIAPIEWHENQSSPFILQGENEAFHNGDAADFPESPEDMVDALGIAREGFVVHVFQGREVGVFGDEDFGKNGADH